MAHGPRTLGWILGVTIAVGAIGDPTFGATQGADLSGDLRRLATDPALARVSVGYAVLDCDGPADSLLAEGHADDLFAPASNLKLLTTGVALDVLGPEFVFETKLLLDVSDGRSRLTLVGSGDPALFHPEIAALGAPRNWTTLQDAVTQWTDALQAANVRQIDDLVIDARIFDGERIPCDSKKWIENEAQGTYAVGLWGLNIGGNAATLDIRATVGKQPWIAGVEPPFLARVASNTAACGTIKPGKSGLEVRVAIASPVAINRSESAFAQPIKMPG